MKRGKYTEKITGIEKIRDIFEEKYDPNLSGNNLIDQLIKLKDTTELDVEKLNSEINEYIEKIFHLIDRDDLNYEEKYYIIYLFESILLCIYLTGDISRLNKLLVRIKSFVRENGHLRDKYSYPKLVELTLEHNRGVG